MPYIGRNHTSGDHVNNFKVLDDISSYTATFDGTATSVVNTTNNTIRVPEHRFIQGQRVTYTNGGGGNIGGLTTGTAYFIIADTANTFKLATSASNATNSTAVNISSVGTGTSHTINASFDGVNTRFKITHGNGVRGDINSATQLNIAINNVVQRPNINSASFTEGFSVEDQHKLVFKIAPTSNDIFWGSIIANNLSTFDISDNKIDTFTGDGSTTEFNLSHVPANNESLMVTINGVLQHPSNATTSRAYTLIASVLKFTAAPANGDEIQVRHLGFAGATTSDVSGFYGRTGNVVLTDQDDITVNKINVGTGVTIESNGQATFVGIVTFGSGSTTIDNNVVNVGTALTLGHTQGLQFHTQNLHSAGFEVNQINSSGIITASSLDISGNVSVGGVLTYEDVTSIDSVGIVTARAGVNITGGNITLGDSSGITDSRIELGDAGDLELFHTGSESKISNANSNLIIQCSANNIELQPKYAEKGLRTIANGATELYWDNNLRLTTTGDGITVDKGITVNGIEGGDAQIRLRADQGDDNNDMFRFVVSDGGTGLHIQGYDGSFQSRISIDTNGKVGIDNASPDNKLSVYDVGYCGLELKSNRNTATDNIGGLHFKTRTTNVAYIQSLVDGTIKFRNSSSLTERLRITSAGHIGFNRSNVDINDTSSQQAVVEPSRFVFNNNYSNNYTDASLKLYLFMYGATRQGFTSGPNYDLQYHSSGHATHAKHSFFTQNTERLRINSNGLVEIKNFSGRGLHLQGAGDPTIRVQDTDGTNQYAEFANNGGQSYIVTRNNTNHGSFILYSQNGSETLTRLHITSGGKIIIGNSGTAYGNGAVQSFIAHTANAGTSGFNSIDTTSVAAGVGGEISFYGKFNTGAQDYAYLGHIRGIKENATAGNTACALTFHTRPTATAPEERLRITSAGTLKFTGQNTSLETAGITHHTNNNLYIRGGTSGLVLGNHDNTNTIHISNSNFIKFETNDGTEKFKINSIGQLTSTASNNGQIIHYFKNTDTTSGSSAMTVEQHFNFDRTGGGLNLSAARIIAGKEREWVGAASNQDGYFAIHTTQNETSAERLRITSNGRVHIRPTNTFYAMNSQSTDLVIGDGGGGRGITFWTAGAADNQTISFQCNESLSRAEGEISYGPTATSVTNDRNAMMFRTNSAERLRITSTGAVLIGTADAGHSSADDLTINNSGNGGITIRTGTTSNGAIFFADSTSGDARFDGFVQYNHGANPYMIFGTATDEKFRITDTGLLQGKSHAHDGGLELLSSNNNQSTRLRLQAKKSDGTSHDWYLDSARSVDRFTIHDGSTSWLTILGTGRVGIGNRTTTPDENLHVHTSSGQANIHVEGATDGQIILRAHSGDSVIHLGDASATSVGKILYDHGTNSLQFSTNSNPRLTITSGGTVAIPSQGASNANPRLIFESSVDSNDFTFSQYEDSNGVYTLIGQNVQLSSNGNTNALDSGHRSSGIFFDGRNHGYLSFLTADAGDSPEERMRIDRDGQVSIFDGTNAYLKPAFMIKNTNHGGWGGAVIFTGEMSNGTEYTQARIRTYGGSGTGDGALAIEAGDLNEVARFKSGKMSIGGLTPNISAYKGIEISNAATTELRLKNTNGGTGQADGFAIQKWSNGNSYIYDYDPNNIVFGVSNSSKMKLYKEGRLSLSPSGGPDAGNSGYALSIVQAGNYVYSGSATGNYPGIHIRSTSTGGGNGVAIYTPDANWGLYSNAGNKTGLALSPNTSSAASANTKLFIREDGHTSLGSRMYEELSDSIKCKVMLSVTGGGLALSGYNLQNATGEDPRHIKNWYSVAESTGATYHHLVTSLWGGGSPHGNTSHIMGGFTIKGYSYGGTYSGISNNTGVSNEDIFFHNWSGSVNHGYKRHYHGSGFDPGNAAYVNSSGYVTLRLKAGRYTCYYIDLYQFQVYAVRDIYVTSHTMDGNTTI